MSKGHFGAIGAHFTDLHAHFVQLAFFLLDEKADGELFALMAVAGVLWDSLDILREDGSAHVV